MTRINSYLTFDGNCREAMQFYKACLGGELVFQTVGESPLSGQLPEPMKSTILHATLTRGDLLIMASDMVSQKGLIRGNAVSLVLHCNSESEIRQYYRKLARGGEKTHPLEVTYWGALFGDLTDRYGNHWVLHYPFKNEQEHGGGF